MNGKSWGSDAAGISTLRINPEAIVKSFFRICPDSIFRSKIK
jgi:hypothetical protein